LNWDYSGGLFVPSGYPTSVSCKDTVNSANVWAFPDSESWDFVNII